jgi:hypothetical protein
MRIWDRQPAELGFAAANTALSALTGLAVYWGLPVRSLWIDVPTGLVAGVLLLSSVGLVSGFRRALLVSRVAGYVLLVWGFLAVATLVLGATLLRATAGIGGGDIVRVVALSVAFAAGYWIVYPLVLLRWLRTHRSGGTPS